MGDKKVSERKQLFVNENNSIFFKGWKLQMFCRNLEKPRKQQNVTWEKGAAVIILAKS